MSHEHRNTLFSLVFSVAFNIYILTVIARMVSQGSWSAPGGPQDFAQSFFIGLAIGLPLIALAWIVARLRRSKEDEPFGFTDERDRTLTFHGLAFIAFGTAVGMIFAMALLAFGHTPLAAFLCVYYGLTLGDMLGTIYKLVRYGKGI